MENVLYLERTVDRYSSPERTAPMAEDFRSILTEYQDRVYTQACRMLGNREEAQEAVQDIFMRVYRSLDSFRGDSKLSTWIFRITANVCISRLRKKQLDMSSLDEPAEAGSRPVTETIADDQPDPGQQMERDETAELVRQQVRRLPPNWAQAIGLYHFEGMSYEEIAEVMQIPRATVATYILRGKKQLAKQLVASKADGVY